MSQIIEIQTSPLVETDQLLAALSAQGLSGAIIGDGPDLRLLVAETDAPLMAGRVMAALDCVGRGLIPFVPEQLDDSTFAVRPPAG